MNIAFIITHLNIGGPSKSLAALLERIDFENNRVDIYVIDGNKLFLAPYFPSKANIYVLDPVFYFLDLPKNEKINTLRFFLKYDLLMFLKVLISYMKIFIGISTAGQERQKLVRFWHNKRGGRNYLISNKKYDKAFGILGNSTYFLNNLNTKEKFHWILGDYRIMNREFQIDLEYYSKINKALAVSFNTKNIFNDFFPNLEVEVLHNPIPIDYYSKIKEYENENKYLSLINEYKKEGNKILISITRIDPLKGFDFIIDTAFHLKNINNLDFKWVVLGDGNEELVGEIMNKIDQLDLSDVFIFCGFQLNTRDFLTKTDVFVHPSLTEGKSNSVDEAKFYGVPVVVTNYPTVSDQVKDEHTGLICEFDANDIASNIMRILNDESIRKKIYDNTYGLDDAPQDLNAFLGEL